MSDEIYESWEPLPDLPARLNLAGLRHTEAGIELRLQGSVGKGPTLTLVFESPVAYRNTDSIRSRRCSSSIPT